MLGDAWQAWWVVLAGTAVAVLLGILAQAILTQEARAFMPISALGGLGFLVLLGCIILFQGGPPCLGHQCNNSNVPFLGHCAWGRLMWCATLLAWHCVSIICSAALVLVGAC